MALNSRCGSQGHPLLRFDSHKSIPYGVPIVTICQRTDNTCPLARQKIWAARKWSIQQKRGKKQAMQAEFSKALK